MRILMVLTSHSVLDPLEQQLSSGYEEVAVAYLVFRDAGVDLVLASPEGGEPPLIRGRRNKDAQSAPAIRFQNDRQARADLSDTIRLHEVFFDEFDAMFYPGGSGCLWDLTNNPLSIEFIEAAEASGKPMGFVAYGPAALIHAQSKRGTALVNGRRLTAFPDVHETAAHLDQRPFSLETELRNLGAHFSASDSEREYVVHDKRLVTGQNIASSAGAARRLLRILKHGLD
jgi:putative intracellular protease/amidase